jgi:hypothetical protein
MEEVPRLELSLLTLDDRQALALEHEDVLLVRLRGTSACGRIDRVQLAVACSTDGTSSQSSSSP